MREFKTNKNVLIIPETCEQISSIKTKLNIVLKAAGLSMLPKLLGVNKYGKISTPSNKPTETSRKYSLLDNLKLLTPSINSDTLFVDSLGTTDRSTTVETVKTLFMENQEEISNWIERRT